MADNLKGNIARTHNSQLLTSDNHSQHRSMSGRIFDDVITILARMPENRRARQVSEWERLRRQTMRSSV